MFRVLIVDDEELVLDGLERILNKISGVSVSGKFHDGKRAAEFLENVSVDAVIADIRMPVMDGLELARWISENKPKCSIVLISAYDEFSYARQAIECGVKNYLMKPVRLPEVKKVIEQLIDLQQSREQELLWRHDFKQEMEELEMFHYVTSQSPPSENKHRCFCEFLLQYDVQVCSSRNLTEDMLRAGFTNIFRWCASQCTPVLTTQRPGEMRYILLGGEQKHFPSEHEILERVRKLMKIDTVVRKVSSGNVDCLSSGNKKDIAQDIIADEIITKAKKYISQNLSRDISRDDVADAVHLDAAYFSKYFKKKAGMYFHDYLQQERIKKVISLLEKGYKVQDAAKEAGFHNRNYFNQLFKQYTGCTPSEYKKKQMTK